MRAAGPWRSVSGPGVCSCTTVARQKKNPAVAGGAFPVRQCGLVDRMPLAFHPIAMMPVVIVIGLMEDIGALGLVRVPPGIVMIGEGHIGKGDLGFGAPAIAVAVAGDDRHGRTGGQ